MTTSKISSKFQVSIPVKIMESLNIKAGQPIQIVPYMNMIEIIPIKPIEEMMGYLNGIDSTIEREEDWL